MQDRKDLIDDYLADLEDHDPKIREEIEESRHRPEFSALEGLESAGGPAEDFALETIVLRVGRPVLDVKGGDAVLDIAEVESRVWKDRLEHANAGLAPNIPAVGRIEVSNHPGTSWLGTGWLVHDNVVVTNRHVAEVFARDGNQGFVFRTGIDGGRMGANIDFLEEFDNERSHEFPVFRILHIEADSGPDLAFLRVEPVNGHAFPSPVELSSDGAKVGEEVAVIGYPARDPFFPDQQLMDRIFHGRYDKKRLAPGLITGALSTRIHHDCTTLGGNSGGEVVSLATGKAVALHFAGTLFAKNHAVPAEVVGNRLEDVLSGRVRTRRQSSPSARVEAEQPQTRVVAATSGGTRVLTASIPIHVRIEIGDVTTAPGSYAPALTPHPAADLDDDDDLLEITEVRPEDYIDRLGFQLDFLGAGFAVPHPTIVRGGDDILTFDFNGENREILDYQHFSVLMSRSRRLCRYSACNIDGATSKKRKRKGWRNDPRIRNTEQIRKECYGNPPKFSRGHMTRREDPVWGTDSDASTGNVDSMHVTNAVPQIQPFNAGIWLSLEDYALDHTRDDDMRISVFTGPFLEENDPIHFGVQIPLVFWKVIAFVHDETGKLSVTGYMMSQETFIGEAEFVFGQHQNRQCSIAEIEERAGLSFGPLAALDPFEQVEGGIPALLMDPAQIRFVR